MRLSHPVQWAALLSAAVAAVATWAAEVELDRTVLPIQLPKRPVITELDARNAKAPPPVEPVAPKGAPNVMIILIDGLGFGATSPFGGPIPTPSSACAAAITSTTGSTPPPKPTSAASASAPS